MHFNLSCDIIKTVKEDQTKERGKKMKYEVIVAGTVIGTYENKADAENRLEQARNSFLAMVHPKNVFYIREKS